MFEGCANPLEAEGGVISSPVSLLGESASYWIPEVFRIEAIGRSLHLEWRNGSRDFRVCLLPGVLEGGEKRPQARQEEPVAHSREMVPQQSWVRGQILSPLHALEPIIVCRRQPHIGVMTNYPGVQEVDEIRIPLIYRKTSSGLE